MWTAIKYIDYVGLWGACPSCGHAHPEVLKALSEALERGTSYWRTLLSRKCAGRNGDFRPYPASKWCGFVNSGTEACMAVLRVMRGLHPAGIKIIKFSGCYHGHSGYVSGAGGSGVATLGLPDPPVYPSPLPRPTPLTAPYKRPGSGEGTLCPDPGEIAGVILEPGGGQLRLHSPPRAGFLEGLREINQRKRCSAGVRRSHDRFRISYGGAQARFNVTPDLTTLGKVIGGGLPVGALRRSPGTLWKWLPPQPPSTRPVPSPVIPWP